MDENPKSMGYNVFVYPSGDDRYPLAAHCLELDVVGTGKSLQASLRQLQELMQLHIEVSVKEGIDIEFPAPAEIQARFLAAKKAGHYIARESIERAQADAKKRSGRKALELANVTATADTQCRYLNHA